ncbi:Uncharacterised protein [Brucella melitensis]|nr:Uncharacterised protein [Brucella melitensis]
MSRMICNPALSVWLTSIVTSGLPCSLQLAKRRIAPATSSAVIWTARQS